MGVTVEDPDAPLECCGRTFKTSSGLSAHQRSPRQCREHPDYDPDADEGRGPTQATKLIGLATDAEDVEYWHDTDMTAWATIPSAGHVEHHRLRTRPFKTWLRRQYYDTEESSPSSQAVQDTVDHLDSVACFDGDEHEAHVRVAELGDAIYLDLCDVDWRIVEVTATGWRVTTAADAPVRFRRRNGMQPLPVPQAGGKLSELRDYINCTEEDWPLVAGFQVAAVRPRGPYPVLNVLGPQGSGKSTATKVVRRTVDPNKADLRHAPSNKRDLILAAVNGQAVALENLSGLQEWLSDALASLATGSGLGTRTLYENDEETIFSACRPVIMNGINEIAVRADLLDRSLLVNLIEIAEEDRQTEAVFWANFEEAWPRILGGLLDAVATGLSNRHKPLPEKLPRMADFAAWVIACAPGLDFTADEFLNRYSNNRASGHALALEASTVGIPVRDLVVDPEVTDDVFAKTLDAWLEARGTAEQWQQDMDAWGKSNPRPGTWTGSAGDLLGALTTDERKRSKDWPQNGVQMAGALRRIMPALRAAGVGVAYDKNRRRWSLERVGSSKSAQTAQTAQGTEKPQVSGTIDPAQFAAQFPSGAQTSAQPENALTSGNDSLRSLRSSAGTPFTPEDPAPCVGDGAGRSPLEGREVPL